MCVRLGHVKFQPFIAKETFLNWGLNGRSKKNARFSTENWPYLGDDKRCGQGYF